MSTTSRILLGFLVFLAAGLYAFDDKLTKRVERQYLEAAEESMVDVAQLLAARLEAEGFDIAGLRREWEAARKREFSAKIYNFTKTTVDMNLYVTDERGVVVFDSDGGRAEGQDYRGRRDVLFTLAGQYGARSTHLDPKDPDSSVMFVAAPIRRDGRIAGVVSVSKAQRSLFAFRDETRHGDVRTAHGCRVARREVFVLLAGRVVRDEAPERALVVPHGIRAGRRVGVDL